MANQHHVLILKRVGATQWNQWRKSIQYPPDWTEAEKCDRVCARLGWQKMGVIGVQNDLAPFSILCVCGDTFIKLVNVRLARWNRDIVNCIMMK